LKYSLLLSVTIIFMSCESTDSNYRYESITNEKLIGVIDKLTSEVFIYDTAKEKWFSIGRPNETPITTAKRP